MNDRFDVLERFIPLFETPEPSFEGFLRRRDRKRRNQRIAAGTVGITVFVAAIWIVTSGEPVDRNLTPAVTGPTSVSNEPAPVGLVGLAPGGAIPSSPAKGDLVFTFVFAHSGGDPGRFGVNLYEDGRVIRQRLGDIPGGVDYPDEPTGFVEQRLTPEGVELLRSEVLATGLVDRDLHLSGLHGIGDGGWITFVDGDRTVEVTWGNVGLDVETIAPTVEQARALQRLDVRLGELSSWLPASAWEDQEPRPFVPSRYSICYDTVPNVGVDVVLGSLPRQAEELLRPLERTHEVSERYGRYGTGFEIWCSTATTDMARSLAEILDVADTADSVSRNVFGLQYEFGQRGSGATEVTLGIAPMLPHEP